jgi:quercetin dioxygenase-like cupin family protein
LRYAVRRLDEIPRAHADDPDPEWKVLEWYPLQHHFGLTAFGVNVYVAREAGAQLLGEHDEAGSNQEEVYLVTSGEATFTLDGETFDAPAPAVVAIPEPAVSRVAFAKVADTTIVAIGGEKRDEFRTSWQRRHFEGVPTATDAGTAS